MKIGFVTDDLSGNSNGIYATAYRYAEELRRQGHTVKLLGYGATGEDAYPLPLRRIPLITRIAASCGFSFAEPDEAVFQAALADVDIVHLFLPFTLETHALLWARERQIPVSAAFHLQPQNMTYNAGFGEAPALSEAIFAWFRKRLYNYVRHIHCPSEMIKSQLEAEGFRAKLHVISNGVPPLFLHDASSRTSSDVAKDTKIHIVSVGRFAPEKNQKTIIDGVAKSAYRDQIVLHLCGQGVLQEELAQRAEACGVDARFAFLPPQKLSALEKTCDLCIHASVVDIEAMSVIEAFAAGAIPLIGEAPLSAPSAYALLPQSLFPAQSADVLAARIDWWVAHPEERKKWRTRYQKKAEELSLARCVERFIAMEKEAIQDDKKAYREGQLSVPALSAVPLLPWWKTS